MNLSARGIALLKQRKIGLLAVESFTDSTTSDVTEIYPSRKIETGARQPNSIGPKFKSEICVMGQLSSWPCQ